MLNKIMDYIYDEEGQTSIEYILLLVVVVLIVIKFKNVAVERMGDLTEKVFGEADTLLQDLSNTRNN